MKRNIKILICIIGCALSATTIRASEDAFGLSRNKASRIVHRTIEAFRRDNRECMIPMMNEEKQDTTILQSWSFRIPVRRAGKAVPREILRLTDTFRSVQQEARSFINREQLPQNTPFSDIRAIYGQGKTIKCAFTSEMNIHSLVFEDDRSACNSYILSWGTAGHKSADSLWLEGFIYECYGHSPYEKHDDVLPTADFNPITGRMIPDGTFREYVALRSKITHMMTRAQVADSTEMAAIVLALEKEMKAYNMSFTWDQHEFINEQILKLHALAEPVSSELGNRCIEAKKYLFKHKIQRDYTGQDDVTALAKEFMCQNIIDVGMLSDKYDYMMIKQGEHYLGNPRIPYLERVKGKNASVTDWEGYATKLPKGIYRLKMAVRADSALWGTSLYVTSNYNTGNFADHYMTRNMYKLNGCGHTGGDIWAQAKAEVEKAKAEGREPSTTDLQIAQANGGKGYGWNWLIVDNIQIYKDKLRFELINNLSGDLNRWTDSDGNVFSYSVCDIVLERVGDLDE